MNLPNFFLRINFADGSYCHYKAYDIKQICNIIVDMVKSKQVALITIYQTEEMTI